MPLSSAGLAAAEELQERFPAAFQRLADLPGLGHRRADLTSANFFFYLVDPYFIVYARQEDPLPILAVVHTSRHIRRLLKKRF